MNKFYLSFFLGLASLTGFGQLAMVDTDNNQPAQALYTINIDAVGTTTTKVFEVHNNYSNSVTVKMKRYLIENASGQDVYYCFGSTCYGANTSPLYAPNQNATIAPGGMLPNGAGTYGLTADFDDNMVIGTTRVLYVLYDANNTSDSLALEIDYVVSAVGLAKLDAKNFALSSPMPNPASSVVNLKYSFASTPQSSSVKVYDMMGVLVKEIKLDGTEGKMQIDVSSLVDGVYLYSLVVNNKAISTKRLVVSK